MTPDLRASIRKSRPKGITALSVFFFVASAITVIASISLAFPHSPLEPIWKVNPRGHAGLTSMGMWAVILMLSVGAACAAAGYGLWCGKSWGRILAILILLTNLAADVANTVSGNEPRAIIGVPIALLLISYLMTTSVRRFVRHPSS